MDEEECLRRFSALNDENSVVVSCRWRGAGSDTSDAGAPVPRNCRGSGWPSWNGSELTRTLERVWCVNAVAPFLARAQHVMALRKLLAPPATQDEYTRACEVARSADRCGVGGVIVAGALYGDFSAVQGDVDSMPLQAVRQQCAGAVQNVTRQVQCMVEEADTPSGTQARVVLCDTPRHTLPGFMDPAPRQVKCLTVRYWYAGRPHVAWAEDGKALTLPKSRHAKPCPHLDADHAALTALASALQCAGPAGGAGRSARRGARRRPDRRRHSLAPDEAAAAFSAATAPSHTALLDAGGVEGGVAPAPPATPGRKRRPSLVKRRHTSSQIRTQQDCTAVSDSGTGDSLGTGGWAVVAGLTVLAGVAVGGLVWRQWRGQRESRASADQG